MGIIMTKEDFATLEKFGEKTTEEKQHILINGGWTAT
jgi:hypothetical protein